MVAFYIIYRKTRTKSDWRYHMSMGIFNGNESVRYACRKWLHYFDSTKKIDENFAILYKAFLLPKYTAHISNVDKFLDELFDNSIKLYFFKKDLEELKKVRYIIADAIECNSNKEDIKRIWPQLYKISNFYELS